MGLCCVDGCEPGDNDHVTYFPIPVRLSLRRKWRDAIKPSVKLHQESVVCSRHFLESDVCTVRGKLRLKGRVVPSLALGDQRDPPPSRKSASPRARPDTPATLDTLDTPGSEPAAGNVDTNAHNGCHQQQQAVPEEAPATADGIASRPDGVSEGNTECADSADDGAENCTIECVPEAILNDESSEGSDRERDFHKEDIEDIIANYHIRQPSERLALARCEGDADTCARPAHAEQETKQTEDKREAAENDNKETIKETQTEAEKKREPDKKKRKADEPEDEDIIEVTDLPHFIEIPIEDDSRASSRSVSRSRRRSGSRSRSGSADCMMLLERVQCDIDPAALFPPTDETRGQVAGDRDNSKGEPISLLTSSDEDDVIIQEPHIDTVDVSSETSEDDVPLVKLLKRKREHKETNKSKIARILWGNLVEYYCFQCSFTATTRAALDKHREEHSRVLLVCEICQFTSASKSQLSRHKKKHREEKRFKCPLCEYKARHNMSLVYHMKSHEDVTVDSIEVNEDDTTKYKCSDCNFGTDSRRSMTRHVKTCSTYNKLKVHKCSLCSYTTKRRNDLKRHSTRKHHLDLS